VSVTAHSIASHADGFAATTPVQTSAGAVVGFVKEGVRRFLGIPYAAPAGGENRYLPPKPVEPWTGVREAFAYGDVAVQQRNYHPRYAVEGVESEDCLSLNVWAPEEVSDATLLPVFVFFHGGGYMSGAGSVATYAGDIWARRGVVAVTMNYRLANLGYLYLDELFDELSDTGVLGALDAAAGLKWVHDNIAAFGGDPQRVTIAGSSAGGGQVNTLLGMPHARRYFQQAAPISIGEFPTTRGPEHAAEVRSAATASARVFLDYLDVEPGDLAALRQVPAEKFKVTAELFAHYQQAGVPLTITPVPGSPSYPEHYFTALERGDAKDIVLMSGVCLDEFGGRHTEAVSAQEALRYQDVPMPRPKYGEPLDLASLFPAASAPSAEEITATYKAALDEAGRPSEDVDIYLAALTDAVMLSTHTLRLQYQAAHNPSTYAFLFAWPSPMHGGILGAFHGVPTPMLFGRVDDPAWATVIGDEPPFSLGEEYFDAFVSFVSSGVPSAPGNREWPAYDLTSRSTMVFAAESHTESNPLGDRLRMHGL
jgi:para-nitrobenzyl esterase